MKKSKLFILFISTALFIIGFGRMAEAAQCCLAGPACTITVSPCDIGGDYSNKSILINVDTAIPVQIILESDLNLNNTDFNFENQFPGANKKVLIDGSVSPSTSANAKNIEWNNGNIVYPSGGLVIDLSVPSSSTGNGGYIDLNGTTSSSVNNSDLIIKTYAGNAADGPPTTGGFVDINFSSDVLLSSFSQIRTGADVPQLVNGGEVDINGSGNIGITGSTGLINTSSSNQAGRIDINGNGNFRAGMHANSCTTGNLACVAPGGVISVNGNINYYAPACNGSSLESKNGGEIDFASTGIMDLPADTSTGGGVLDVNAAVFSDCTCCNPAEGIGCTGGACRTQLNANNIVNFSGVSCNPAAFTNPHCDSSAEPEISNVTSTNADGFYKALDVIDITVKFSALVAVTGSPTLELETGAINRKAVYIGGTGTDTLVFRYVVQSGDTSSDLDYVGTGSLVLNGGTIKKNASAINAVLALPVPGTNNSLSFNKDIIIDTTIPSAIIVAFDKSNNIIVDGANISNSADVNPAYFHSTAWDNIAVSNNIIKWTTNGSSNEVNCGSEPSCWVRIQGVIPIVSYSTESAASPDLVTSWINCTLAVCSVVNQLGPFLDGDIIKYRAQVLDAANNSNLSGQLAFTINVANTEPTVSGLSTNEDSIDYCDDSSSFVSINLFWIFADAEDANQTAYKLKITRSDGVVYDPGVVSSNLSLVSGSYIQSVLPGFLRYNTGGSETYSWEVTVYDSDGADNGPKAGPDFSFPKHQYPDVGFAPPPPSNFIVNTPIDFTVFGNINSLDNTKCYPAGDNTSCKNWIWDFDYDGAIFTHDKEILGSTNGNWTHTYSFPGAMYKIVLQVTDNDDYICSNSDNPEILGAIRPKWKEVVPR